jgi:diaminopimelate decarboxylase
MPVLHGGPGAPAAVVAGGAGTPHVGHLPPGCSVNPAGRLCCAGFDVVDLVARYGSPLYVFNEDVIRGTCRAYRAAVGAYPGGAVVAYAAKACLTLALAAVVAQEGLHLDVVSGGELQTALAAGFPAARMHFHGNNKGVGEIEAALEAGVGRFVVDNFRELDLLDAAARRLGVRQDVLLRVAPGIEAHTHEYIRTGGQDSKFGFDLQSGQVLEAARRVSGLAGIRCLGLHAHVGSQILDTAVVAPLVEALLDAAAGVRAATGAALEELNLGGGPGIRYAGEERTVPPAEWVAAVSAAVVEGCRRRDLPLPTLVLEPGRSIVGEAGIALYTVGATKRVPGLVPWVAVDGGMGDNIRPALYGAVYTVAAAGRMRAAPEERVHVVGRFCESGDFLARSVDLPRLEPGEVLAFFSAGAYQYPMASNYNRVPRPCLLLVSTGRCDVMVERETVADLLRRDRLPEHLRGLAAAP